MGSWRRTENQESPKMKKPNAVKQILKPSEKRKLCCTRSKLLKREEKPRKLRGRKKRSNHSLHLSFQPKKRRLHSRPAKLSRSRMLLNLWIVAWPICLKLKQKELESVKKPKMRR